MVGDNDMGLLTDVSLNTVILNVLQLVENRLKSFDFQAKNIANEIYSFQNTLSAAIRASADPIASKKLISAIQIVNRFYLKYGQEFDETDMILKQVEKRYLTALKDALTDASVSTMAKMDSLSIGLLRDTMVKRGIINTNYGIELNTFQKLKEKLFKKKGNDEKDD